MFLQPEGIAMRDSRKGSRRWTVAFAAVAIWLCVPSSHAAAQADGPILGFAGPAAQTQLSLETAFDALLDADNLAEWMERMTSAPFYVGAPHNRENAEFTAQLFRDWGYDVEIEEYRVLFPTPRIRELEMLAPEPFTARLEEPVIDADPTSGVEGRLPTYNAYSADGDVTGELVYVNQGIPADYEDLERLGIDVRGKIVIARYGGSWRGIKPKVAAEHGAIATILYSDPLDDGYYQGDTYPEGPFRRADGVQRGSVADMPLFPGDPLTPGVGATEDAPRLPLEEAPTLMKIPVLPISHEDALPLLRALDGPVAPPNWRGALPITYHVGPGPAQVRVRLEFDWDLQPAYNVIARLEGSEFPDEWVMRGNHRDGWAMGAQDPISGHVSMMEEARAIGALARQGQRPRRTVVYASWDAEEPGLLGSTEWVEHHADELDEKLAVYINTDGSGRGFLRMGGSHTLQKMMNQVARAVDDPQTDVTVWEREHARRAVQGDREPDARGDLTISPLGSGSDYTPFLQHLGAASLHLSFGGESSGGSYHSQFDSFDHYTRFGDPDFAYGVTLARVTGRATLRAANADVLPFLFGPFVESVEEYRDEVLELLEETREATERANALIAANAYVLSADPTRTYVPPAAEEEVPHLNFAPLQNAIERLKKSAADYDRMLHAALTQGAALPADLAPLNARLIATERAMTHPEGLPRRGWFRHQIYAPGFYTGYGVKTLPGVREAIEQRAWDEAEAQIARLGGTLAGLADVIDAATTLLR
ncbi:MAG TPA: transferrin receptor-like dimerization domain-containing protein [Longimicrobiales bacterium]|nr:transferrin receptor-like dimerization domain-containing protein [Longimicrobiales bacterium]